ncbi:MAG: helix-turn-helix domain-containing protein [Akkermansiaceae bacterium]|nr:helix-turn-helix domain-containing protein [Akkermansiaceae bacterium]
MDEAGLSPAEFRVFCHLLRSADNHDGVAWPSYKRMVEAMGMSRATVARCIDTLESRQLVQKIGKPFGGSCRYRVFPIVSPESGLEGLNGLTTERIGNPPIVSPEKRNMLSHETSIVSPESKEGSPQKVPHRRFPTTFVETLWNRTPSKGRERSSKKQLEAALKKLPRDVTEETIIEGLEGWKRSESWTKDNGQFVPGVHRWVNDRKWESIPEPTTTKPAQSSTLDLGRRGQYQQPA